MYHLYPISVKFEKRTASYKLAHLTSTNVNSILFITHFSMCFNINLYKVSIYRRPIPTQIVIARLYEYTPQDTTTPEVYRLLNKDQNAALDKLLSDYKQLLYWASIQNHTALKRKQIGTGFSLSISHSFKYFFVFDGITCQLLSIDIFTASFEHIVCETTTQNNLQRQ